MTLEGKKLRKITEPIFRVPIEVLHFKPKGQGNYETTTYDQFLYIDAPSVDAALDEVTNNPTYWSNWDKLPDNQRRLYSPIRFGTAEVVEMAGCEFMHRSEYEEIVCGLRLDDCKCGDDTYCNTMSKEGGCYLEGCPPSDFPGCPYSGMSRLEDTGAQVKDSKITNEGAE